jgi:hypothetical protein
VLLNLPVVYFSFLGTPPLCGYHCCDNHSSISLLAHLMSISISSFWFSKEELLDARLLFVISAI